MKIKKIIYQIATTFLGLLLSFLTHAIIEIWYLKWADRTGHIVKWTSVFGKGLCALPIFLQIGLFILGGISGFLLGLYWWRIVYVEKKHWFSKKKE